MPRRSAKAPYVVPSPVPISAEIRQNAIIPPREGRSATNKRPSKLPRTLSAVPRHKDLIWTIDNFFTPAECAAWLSYLSESSFAQSSQRATAYTAFRDNGRKELCSADVANAIWTRLRLMLPEGLAEGTAEGCYDKIRLYEYAVGQRFGKHIDEAAPISAGVSTGATVLIYLNDDGLEGGETVFYDGRRDEKIVLSFRPKRGSLLIHGYVKLYYFFELFYWISPQQLYANKTPLFSSFFMHFAVCVECDIWRY